MARGRQADTPTDIPGTGWMDIAWRVKDRVGEDRVGLVAAGVAFYALLALFPAITALLAISGLVTEPTQIVGTLESAAGIVPQAAMDIILTQAREVAGSQTGGLGLAALVGLGLAIYSASKGVGSLMQGLNIAYGEDEERGFIVKLLTTLALTMLLVLVVLVGLLSAVAIPVILAFVDFGPATEMLGSVLIALALFGLAVVALAIVYRYGPSRDNPQFDWTSHGALIACVLWVFASVGFAIYVANFGSYNESFGSLAGVVVLLMWLWISAYIVLLGAEINAETEAQTRRDTTVGKRRPMGDRDATKADRLGEARA